MSSNVLQRKKGIHVPFTKESNLPNNNLRIIELSPNVNDYDTGERILHSGISKILSNSYKQHTNKIKIGRKFKDQE